jgi:hypothetical protein
MSIQRIAYWTTTAVLVFVLVSGGIAEIGRMWGTMETVTILGYPAYFLTIIGLWKVAGGLALILPRLHPTVRDWAYAGIVFNMTGAAASHVLVGDFGPSAFHVTVTLSLAVLALVSRALRLRGIRPASDIPVDAPRQLAPATSAS